MSAPVKYTTGGQCDKVCNTHPEYPPVCLLLHLLSGQLAAAVAAGGGGSSSKLFAAGHECTKRILALSSTAAAGWRLWMLWLLLKLLLLLEWLLLLLVHVCSLLVKDVILLILQHTGAYVTRQTTCPAVCFRGMRAVR